jgi:hypothetical protein
VRAALCLSLLCACAPALEDRSALVDRPRLLAVRAEPAEARPGEEVVLRPLVATPPRATAPALSWALCLKAKAVAESGAVAAECAQEGSWIRELGLRAAEELVTVRIPGDACALFGPTPPPPAPGQPARRPVDPDSTGGYSLPVRATLEGETVFARVRLRCDSLGVPVQIARELRERYRVNEHPSGLLLEENGVLSWSQGAEPYVIYDSTQVALVERTERLTLSFYATGAVGIPRQRAEGTEARTDWEGTRLWAVLRDDRGGVAWADLRRD